jgi:hypothetical protein
MSSPRRRLGLKLAVRPEADDNRRMPKIVATESAEIPAAPAVIYRILADYRTGHPNILPPKQFFDLQVESGGYGAGTIFRFKMRLAGLTREVRGEVSEPDPGRLLVETYPDTGFVTSFEIVPQDGGGARVTIKTVWQSAGVRGFVESHIVPRLLRRVYIDELQRLARLACDRERFRNSRETA